MNNESLSKFDEKIEKWIDNLRISPDKYGRYKILLNFVKDVSKRSCCNSCRCMACDATDVLRGIGEYCNHEYEHDFGKDPRPRYEKSANPMCKKCGKYYE